MSSPSRKKMKIVDSANSLKREHEPIEESNKRQKTGDKVKKEEDLQAKKRRNFITACEIVSYKAYFNHQTRFQLTYLPSCAKGSSACKHQDYKHNCYTKQMPPYTEESFKIEMKTNMWREALEVCRLCITKDQYLSARVLKDVVEIMLNAHDNEYADFTIEYLIDKCQEIFELNFSFHPPCLTKNLRKCYNDFLTTPMDLKENTFTNRTQFECDKGIVKYCMNRLEYEISMDSKDEPMLDKYENIPEEMKQSVKGLHWQKEKFEIYELLDRTERIGRIMTVLDSIVELLQFDLAIWHSRYTNNLGCHVMRSHKPLMACLLWSNNVLYTGAVNNNCRQILKLFVYLIHLKYPEKYIYTITVWLNTMIQTFYICETNSNTDYPNIGKYCTTFANEFYKIISGMPQESIIRILERIKPDYMQYLIGTLHSKKLLSIQEENPIKILSIFIGKLPWTKFTEDKTEIKIFKHTHISTSTLKNFFSFIRKKCESLKLNKPKPSMVHPYEFASHARFDPELVKEETEISLNHVVHTLYITLDAYLDAHSVQNMQDTLDMLNEQLLRGETSNEESNEVPEFCSYSVTEHFIKRYRSIYQTLRELMVLLQNKKNSEQLPEALKVFEKIGLLGM